MHFFPGSSLWNRESPRISAAGILSLQKPWGLKPDNIRPGHVKVWFPFLLVNGTFFPVWNALTCVWVVLGKCISVIVFTALSKHLHVFMFVASVTQHLCAQNHCVQTAIEQILPHCCISYSPPNSQKNVSLFRHSLQSMSTGQGKVQPEHLL